MRFVDLQRCGCIPCYYLFPTEVWAVGGRLAAWPPLSNPKLAMLRIMQAILVGCLAGYIGACGVSDRGPERRNPVGHEYRVGVSPLE